MCEQNENYEGKFVFVESTDKSNSYYNGEYFVLRQTPATLYCIKPVAGYGGQDVRQINLVGEKPYTVIESWSDDAETTKSATAMIAWGEKINDPTHTPQWISSVYTGCADNGKTILRLLAKRKEALTVDDVVKALAATYCPPRAFWGSPQVGVAAATEIKSTLEQRVRAIEDRENRLARLYREASEVELARNTRAADLRAMPAEKRWRTSAFTGRVTSYTGRTLLKDDPEYRGLVQRWEGIMDAIRRIRSTPLSA